MPRWLHRLFAPVVLPHWSSELLLLVPRIVCGFLLTTQFGAPKFGLPWSPPDNNLGLFEVAFWFPNDVAQFGGIFAAFPAFFAWMGAFAEGAGGVALILGLFTRPFALLTICTMLVAMFLQQFQGGLWNMLPSLGFAWVGLYLLVLGSGRTGLDHWIASRWTASRRSVRA
jgi:putative oxidoreductase